MDRRAVGNSYEVGRSKPQSINVDCRNCHLRDTFNFDWRDLIAIPTTLATGSSTTYWPALASNAFRTSAL